MRVLVLGAGGTGGYFGGRLAQSGADITFLVRAPRAAQLDRDGLRIRSPLGDADIAVASVIADGLATQFSFDLVLLSCKAYDLDGAIDAIAPAMQAGAVVLPILNGLRHYATLDARFGAAQVAGGLCFISAMKGADGEILHLGKPASITFGERDGNAENERLRAFETLCARAGIDHLHTPRIDQALWIKYCFLATLAAGTCLMRANSGRIVAANGGAGVMEALYRECLAIAAAANMAVPADAAAQARATLTQPGSALTASMLRDLEAGQPVEADHIVGDMLRRGHDAGVDVPLLATAWVHLQAYMTARDEAATP